MCLCFASMCLWSRAAVETPNGSRGFSPDLNGRCWKTKFLSWFICVLHFFLSNWIIFLNWKRDATQRHQHFLRFFRDLGLSLASWFCFHVTVCWCAIADHLQVFADLKQKMGPSVPNPILAERKWDHWRKIQCSLVKIIRIIITRRMFYPQMFKRLCLRWISSQQNHCLHSQICTSTLLSPFLLLLLIVFFCYSCYTLNLKNRTCVSRLASTPHLLYCWLRRTSAARSDGLRLRFSFPCLCLCVYLLQNGADFISAAQHTMFTIN